MENIHIDVNSDDGVKGQVVNPLCVGRLHRVRFHSSDTKIVIRVCCKRRLRNLFS